MSGSAIVDCAQGVCKATGCLTGYKFNSSSGTCVQKCGDGKCDEATEGYDSDKKEIICMKDCGCKGPSTDEINLFLKGTVSGIQYSSKKWITASDSCNGTDKVNKQYCIIKGDNSYALYAISKCPSGSECKEGACVKSTPAVILGDVDGDNTLTTFDAVLVLRHVVGDATLTPDQQTKANVNSCENGGEALDSFDAVLILRKFVGEITKFPCE
ncbi:hypothetical protein HZC32_03880 [Candidatus Woesearchaeota archaeon]|nr:hypothetical protein [Candidatus Woesearchaeota archaeon]